MIKRAPKWLDRPPRRAPGPGKIFLTTDRYPVFYLQITKCGCTFLRNLIYTLDHDQPHPDALRIHAHDDDFMKAAMVPNWLLRKSPYVFTVVRDPVDRFLSLYFDKFADVSSPYDKKMRANVSEAAGLQVTSDSDLTGHRENCLKTLNWLAKNLAGETDVKINAHWQRQSHRISRAKDLPLKFLTLEGLGWQLPQLLEPVIPDIRNVMASVKSRNVSPKLFSRDEILTPEIAETIEIIYLKDAETFANAKANWGPAPEGSR